MVNIESIIYNIKLPPGFSLKKAVYCDTDRCYIQIKQRGECNRTGEEYEEGGRKWDISQYMTESEIVFTVFKALLTFVEHELRESFEYKGHKIFDPHTSVEALMVACKTLDVRG